MTDKIKVVIAVNNSETSKYAFKWALNNFLCPEKHKVTILTVVEPPMQAGFNYGSSAVIIDEIYAKAQDEAKILVKAFEKELEAHFKMLLPCEMIIGRGEIRDEIVDYVEDSKSNLLIIGSRDMNTLKRTFVGSTSDYCVHHCHCPVLVVKKE